jgi:gliding motility-associated-like protein
VLDLPETSVTNNLSPYCVEETNAGLVLNPVDGTLEGNGVVNNIFNPSLAGVGTHPVIFYYTDDLGCTDTTFLTVEVVGLPEIIINVPNSLCINDAAFDLSASPAGGSFTLNGNPATVLDPAALGLGIHTVTYVVTDQNGCTNTETKSFTINPIPTIDFNPEFQEDCPPLTATFTAETSPVVSCLWDFGDGNTSSQCNTVTHTFEQSGCFDVSIFVVDENGCTNESIAEEIICVFPKPIADFGHSPDTVSEFFTEVNFTNLSQNGYFYDWTFNGGTPDFSTEVHPIVDYPEGVVQDYEVSLFITSEFGCVDSITKIVPVVSDVLIYVPNTFTPDDDKFNELWEYVIEGIDVNTFHMEVFNRWGELIWESRNPSVFWDGFYGNQKVKTGTYVWRITATDNHTDEVYQWLGHVNVLY